MRFWTATRRAVPAATVGSPSRHEPAAQPIDTTDSSVEFLAPAELRRRVAPLRRFLNQPPASVFAGWLFLASGILGLLNLAVPLPAGQPPTVYVALSLLDVVLALAVWMLPWHRWHPRATVAVVPTGYVVVALFEAAGALTPYAYASFFMLIAVWLGLFHPPRVSLWLVPITTVAYVVPLLDAPAIELRSALVVVPISVVVAQLVARVATKAEHTRQLLAEQATRDPLTGLPNRRYFEQTLVQLFAGDGRTAHPTRTRLAAVAFDLDHFRDINNRYGHEGGDVVLRRFTELLRAGVRAEDLVARVGGEEFTVVLPGRGLDDAIKVAERVRQSVAEAAIEVPTGDRISVTVSAGCSELVPADHSGEQLLRAADVGLAMAKRAGRNRTVAV